MQFEVFFRNGMRLVSSNDLVNCVYNNSDVEKVILTRGRYKWIVNLDSDARLIFWRDINFSSPPQTVYNIGYQKTIKGKNVKTIMKIFPDNKIELVS